jgi:hypothetical protein
MLRFLLRAVQRRHGHWPTRDSGLDGPLLLLALVRPHVVEVSVQFAFESGQGPPDSGNLEQWRSLHPEHRCHRWPWVVEAVRALGIKKQRIAGTEGVVVSSDTDLKRAAK